MTSLQPSHNSWKILVVDDKDDVHVVTRLALSGLHFEHRDLNLLEARSSIEAVRLFAEHPDIAVALIDVVMETEGAGLQLVHYVRKRMRNHFVRLVMLIEQSDIAPERSVIAQYEIDDYKTRSELSTSALFTSVSAALRSFHNLRELDASRRIERRQLEAANAIFRATDLSTLATLSTAKALVMLELEQDAYWGDSAGAWWVEMPTATEGKVLAAIGHCANTPHEQLLALADDSQGDALHLMLEIPTEWHRRFRLCVTPGRPQLPRDREFLELLRLQAILVANSLLAKEMYRASDHRQTLQTVNDAGNTPPFSQSMAARCEPMRTWFA